MKECKKSLNRSINAFKLSPKSQNSLSTGKFMQNQLNPTELSKPCLTHTTEQISHFCETCQYKPLCGLCLQQGNHKNHSVKNVQKASKIVNRIMTETLISMRSKSNLLEVLGQHIQARKQQINTELIQYVDSVNQQIQAIQIFLEQRKQNIIKTVKQFYKRQSEKILQAQKICRQQNHKIKTMIQILSQKSQKLQPIFICLYFYQKKQTLQSALEEETKIYQQIKKAVPDLRWTINLQVFQMIKSYIDYVKVIYTNNSIQITSGVQNKLKDKIQRLDKTQLKQKSLKKIRFDKQKNHNITQLNTGFWTPKHVSNNKQQIYLIKIIIKNKKITQIIKTSFIIKFLEYRKAKQQKQRLNYWQLIDQKGKKQDKIREIWMNIKYIRQLFKLILKMVQ